MNFYRLNFHSRNGSEIQLGVYWELETEKIISSTPHRAIFQQKGGVVGLTPPFPNPI